MQKYLSPAVRAITPYVPGEQPRDRQYIKLNTNENPYPPSPQVVAAITAATGAALRLYPDPECTVLKDAVAEYYGVERTNVFVGNGSDEVLALAFMAFFQQDRPLVFPDITYSFYPVYCDLFGITARTVPLTDDFSIDLGGYPADNGGIILPNPNAPTGRFLPLSCIEELLARNTESVVAVDEAYVDFGGESAVGLIQRYPNLLVIQTLSKSRSLAGLRVGFAIGQPGLIDGLERVKNSFNSYPLDRLALAGAVAAMADRPYFEKTCQAIISTRDWTTDQMAALGFFVVPSTANFLFARHPARSATELFAALRQKGVLVRHFNLPRISEYLRITIGTDDEMRTFVEVLTGILA